MWRSNAKLTTHFPVNFMVSALRNLSEISPSDIWTISTFFLLISTSLTLAYEPYLPLRAEIDAHSFRLSSFHPLKQTDIMVEPGLEKVGPFSGETVKYDRVGKQFIAFSVQFWKQFERSETREFCWSFRNTSTSEASTPKIKHFNSESLDPRSWVK